MLFFLNFNLKCIENYASFFSRGMGGELIFGAMININIIYNIIYYLAFVYLIYLNTVYVHSSIYNKSRNNVLHR